MIPKKMLLLSATLLLSLWMSAPAQQASTTAPVAPTAATPTVAIAASGGNYLGVATVEVTRENMGRYNMREPRGVAVLRVAPGSPAERAGIKVGDVILKFNGEQVTTFRKLQRLLDEAAPEQNVQLSVSRNGAEQGISVTLGRRKDAIQSLAEIYGSQPGTESRRALEDLQRNQGLLGFGWGRRIGVSTTQLTRQLADYFGVAGGRGLLITAVTENSPAARAGLKAGDVITEIDGEKIESAGDLSRAINRKTEGDVTLTVVRDRSPRSVRVTPEKREAGAISISPELLQIDPAAVEISMPAIEIRMPQIRQTIPMVMPRINLPTIKIKPEMLQKIETIMQQTQIL